MAWLVIFQKKKKKFFNFFFNQEFAHVSEIMENLEKNTAHWREQCDLQQQEPLHTNKPSIQQDIRSRNESIVEVVDENT